MKIHISEHKSIGEWCSSLVGNAVRVFVDQDYQYGYFVDEHQLFGLLREDQKVEYLQAVDGIKFDVMPQLAQAIIDIGATPYSKPRVI